jgi:hypothetical protein
MKNILFFAAAMAACGAASAAGIGVRAGTTGIGVDVAFNVLPAVDARIGYSGLKWAFDTDTSDARYDGDLKLSNLSTLLDFRPLGPLFRITGGLVFNDNKFEAVGRPNAVAGSFNATVESGRSAAPYLGIGWGNVGGRGVNFYADLGVMFMGSPKATINANCSGLTAGQCAALQNEVTAEQQRLQDELKVFKYYPVLNLGLTIGF